jgi:hypothetical protein
MRYSEGREGGGHGLGPDSEISQTLSEEAVKLKPDNKFQIPDYRGRTAEYF